MKRIVTVRIGSMERRLRCHCRALGTRYVDRSQCYVHGGPQPRLADIAPVEVKEAA